MDATSRVRSSDPSGIDRMHRDLNLSSEPSILRSYISDLENVLAQKTPSRPLTESDISEGNTKQYDNVAKRAEKVMRDAARESSEHSVLKMPKVRKGHQY